MTSFYSLQLFCKEERLERRGGGEDENHSVFFASNRAHHIYTVSDLEIVSTTHHNNFPDLLTVETSPVCRFPKPAYRMWIHRTTNT